MKTDHMAEKEQTTDRSREHLKHLRVLALEERDRLGYEAQPQRVEEYRAWEEAAAWPEEPVPEC